MTTSWQKQKREGAGEAENWRMRSGGGGGGGAAPLLKSRDPHLAGGETQKI